MFSVILWGTRTHARTLREDQQCVGGNQGFHTHQRRAHNSYIKNPLSWGWAMPVRETTPADKDQDKRVMGLGPRWFGSAGCARTAKYRVLLLTVWFWYLCIYDPILHQNAKDDDVLTPSNTV